MNSTIDNNTKQILNDAHRFWYKDMCVHFDDLLPDLYGKDDADKKYARMVLDTKTDKKTLRYLAIGFLASSNLHQQHYNDIKNVPDKYELVQKQYHKLASRYNRLLNVAKDNMQKYYPIDIDPDHKLPF